MRRLSVLLAALLLTAGCSEPPQKELNRAQGAMDAARAAGAQEYASEVYTAAASALQQAHDAVAQRDYRLALSRAIDAGERAEEAARLAADGKAAARSQAERAMAATSAASLQLGARIKAAEAARVPPKDLAPARHVAAAARAVLQKARAELGVGSYLAAAETLKGAATGIPAQIRALDDAIAARPARRGPSRR